MSMQHITVPIPPVRAVPRGALVVGALVDVVLRAGAWLRGRVEARRSATSAQPAALRAARRDARDRARLLALAHRYESSQPEFAKDLFAAAKRDSA